MMRSPSVLLEPVMRVEIATPAGYLGAIIGDFQGRRGSVLGSEMKGTLDEIAANVPLANMFGYVSVLRSLSQGRAPILNPLARFGFALVYS